MPIYKKVGIGILLCFFFFILPYIIPLPNNSTLTYSDISPREGSYITIDGYESFVIEKNPAAKNTIVFIHGFAGNTQNWRNVIETLKNEGNRIIAIDLINFGFSERDRTKQMSHSDQAELIYQILTKIEVERAVFVGHSMGSSVISHLYINYPNLIEGLIFISPSINHGEQKIRISEILLKIPGLEKWYRIFFRFFANKDRLSKILLGLLISDNYNEEEIISAYLNYYDIIDWDLGIINSVYYTNGNFIDVIKLNETPKCTIWGSKDTITPRKNFEDIIMVDSTMFFEMDNAGHLPFEDSIEVFNYNMFHCLDYIYSNYE